MLLCAIAAGVIRTSQDVELVTSSVQDERDRKQVSTSFIKRRAVDESLMKHVDTCSLSLLSEQMTSQVQLLSALASLP